MAHAYFSVEEYQLVFVLFEFLSLSSSFIVVLCHTKKIETEAQ
jgi:hypothetical protein